MVIGGFFESSRHFQIITSLFSEKRKEGEEGRREDPQRIFSVFLFFSEEEVCINRPQH